MAQPITEIQKQQLTEEQIKQQKLEKLTTLLANNEEALDKVLAIMSELNHIGVLEAANSMLQAKEDIATIALGQVTREPVTNLINTLMGVAGAFMNTNPELATKFVNSAIKGMNEANDYLQTDHEIQVFDLLKSLKDPDINRALGFGIHFLKGMGKELKSEE